MYKNQLEEHSENIFPESTDEHLRVKRVFGRLIPHSGLDLDSWTVHVVNDPELGAFVLPNGQVFVYSGMLDFCNRDDELAVVLGHEIAHVLTHHVAERVSRVIALVPVAGISALTSGIDFDLVDLAVDVAFRYPHMRQHEVEADYLGLLVTARSGYDPHAALDLWTRWEEVEDYTGPSFLRTHPSHHDRLTRMVGWLSQARVERLVRDVEGMR